MIVLSHDPGFLRLLFDIVPGSQTQTLQLSGWGTEGTKLTAWDLIAGTRPDYIHRYMLLSDFVTHGVGETRHVAQTIRVFLEEYMRLKLPTSFAETEWLGDFIREIRDCTDATDPLNEAKSIVEELSQINNFAKKYHHSTPGSDSAAIDPDELLVYAKRTIKFVQSF